MYSQYTEFVLNGIPVFKHPQVPQHSKVLIVATAQRDLQVKYSNFLKISQL